MSNIVRKDKQSFNDGGDEKSFNNQWDDGQREESKALWLGWGGGRIDD